MLECSLAYCSDLRFIVFQNELMCKHFIFHSCVCVLASRLCASSLATFGFGIYLVSVGAHFAGHIMDMTYHDIKLGGGYFTMCYEDGFDDWHIALLLVLRMGYGLSKNCRYRERIDNHDTL